MDRLDNNQRKQQAGKAHRGLGMADGSAQR